MSSQTTEMKAVSPTPHWLSLASRESNGEVWGGCFVLFLILMDFLEQVLPLERQLRLDFQGPQLEPPLHPLSYSYPEKRRATADIKYVQAMCASPRHLYDTNICLTTFLIFEILQYKTQWGTKLIQLDMQVKSPSLCG